MFVQFVLLISLCYLSLSHANDHSRHLGASLEKFCTEKQLASENICKKLKLSKNQKILSHYKTKPLHLQAMHVHLPQLKVIEEEDDFFNDNIYMWFIMTVDGIPYSKVTSIYRGLDEGDILVFNHIDRIINDLIYKRQLIIEWGIVESDGDDISKLQELSRQSLRLIQLYMQSDASQSSSQLSIALHQQSAEVLAKLLELDHDDKLISGTLVLDARATNQTINVGGLYDFNQGFKGSHLGSDWHYELTWRFLMVDISPPALFYNPK
ncbi:MAG: hypothetical protein CME71_02620 [Halobacteriovorax sp.]|nr:hypothetical protein [Halobacteriovorax sp.]